MNEIRLLRKSDMAAMMRLSAAAGWNQTSADWQRLLDLEPEGCFGLVSGGELAATTTAVRYGTRLAWIGMVLTHPAHRRRGYARRLMEHAIGWLEQRGVDWIKLDATPMGQPLYRQLGFEEEGVVERWSRPASAPPLPPPNRPAPPRLTVGSTGFPAPLAALDELGFGAPRAALLRLLAGGGWVLAGTDGYAMGRLGSTAFTVGPCVARSPEVALTLLDWQLRPRAGALVYWDLLPDNSEALRLAGALGFAPQRRLARMVRASRRGAEPLHCDDSLVYAAAGFEYG